ncbi:ABC transporter ATP-binding protein [Enterococcus florum]|uniref:ABC transporter ATP-binding protein n=1 Tax=Enterococcus florum TaxID=2480627 RepID=A0A4P5P7F8_9ENTE|nr:ABC transporter ATP-binding protein [Enterococcus florum]GCF92124.1 ABC transporter ATP-binding protein [Enterococcus florum]
MITVKNVNFSYTKQPFLQDITFSVQKGEIFGFLGPSGAGKSTLQKILIGLISNYEGEIWIDGMERREYDNQFYERIGVDFEFPTLYEKFSAKQNLNFFGSLYQGPLRRIDELLESVGLQNEGSKRVSDFSKGMKTRLNFIRSLIHDPDILFLDEPTSGLDPVNSQKMKELILAEKAKGKLILLTTHNMYDATELCDQVAFISEGRILALDSPHHLIMAAGAAKIRYSYLEKGESVQECLLKATSEDRLLQQLIQENRLLSIHSSEPTLNDLFIELTGRSLE